MGVVHEFGNKQWTFPVRTRKGPRPGDLQWVELTRNRVNSVLRNPRYAGAYAYGQTRHRQKVDGGRIQQRLPREQCGINCKIMRIRDICRGKSIRRT